MSVITLYQTATWLIAYFTTQCESIFRYHSLSICSSLVSKAYFRYPIHTIDMSPRISNRFYYTFQIRTQIALDRCTSYARIQKQCAAASTIPRIFIFRQSIQQITTIAFLVGCSKAKFAYHNLITLIIIAVLADITNYIIVILIFNCFYDFVSIIIVKGNFISLLIFLEF